YPYQGNPSMSFDDSASLFVRDGHLYVPTGLTRGPWDENAQHGGAPAALLAHVAENTVGDAEFFLARLTFELTRPIPIAPLEIRAETGQGRNVRRVDMAMEHDGKPVGRAIALLLRSRDMAVPRSADDQLTPGPQDATGRFGKSGLTSDAVSFSKSAMDVRVARGDSGEPGPGAAWFRLCCPVVGGEP